MTNARKPTYTRYEFLKTLGFSGGALMAVLTGCVNAEDKYVTALELDSQGNVVGSDTTPPGILPPTTTVISTEALNSIKTFKLKVDLSAAASKNLLTVGGYIIQSNIVLAQVSAGVYAAVENLCTHEPKRRLIFNKNEWYCTDHGARFNTNSGSPLNTVARSPITVYKVATDGKTVVVYA